MKHLSHHYRRVLLILILSNWVLGKSKELFISEGFKVELLDLVREGVRCLSSDLCILSLSLGELKPALAGLVLGCWQGTVHHAGPASCAQHHRDYFLCGAETGVAKVCRHHHKTLLISTWTEFVTCLAHNPNTQYLAVVL